MDLLWRLSRLVIFALIIAAPTKIATYMDIDLIGQYGLEKTIMYNFLIMSCGAVLCLIIMDATDDRKSFDEQKKIKNEEGSKDGQ